MSTKTTFDLSVSEDRMAVLFSCEDVMQIDSDVIDEIIARLRAMRIAAVPFRDDLIDKIKNAYVKDSEIRDLVLVEGEPFTMATIGRIEWARDFFAQGWRIDESGRMNYREHISNRMVKTGELLGKLNPPIEAATGVDVFGRIVHPPKLLDRKLTPGPSVEYDERTREIYAMVGGMLRFTDNVVEIDKVHVLDDINLESGNIRFSGSVIVRNEVEDMAIVQAGGTVEVNGSVGAAQISAVGDVMVRHGISGREKARIVCGGKVSAQFIINTGIEAEKGVLVGREIVNCKIYSRGSVEVESGRIVGGELVALGEIIVGEAGSTGNVTTLLAAGEDYKMSDFLKARQMDIDRVEQLRRRVLGRIGAMTDRLRLLTAEQREEVTELMARADNLDAKVEELRTEIRAFVQASERNSIKQIFIKRILHPGVTLRIQGLTRTITRTHKGPIVAKADLRQNKIVF